METITINGQSYEVIVTEHEFFEDDKYTIYIPSREVALIISENIETIFIVQSALYDGRDGREHVIMYADLPPVCRDKVEEWIKEVMK